MWGGWVRAPLLVGGVVAVLGLGSLLVGRVAGRADTAHLHGKTYSCPFTPLNCKTLAPSAVVNFRSRHKAFTIEAVSDSSGHYAVSLPPDEYVVEQKITTHPMGYKGPIVITVPWGIGPGDVTVRPGDDLQIDFVAANSFQ